MGPTATGKSDLAPYLAQSLPCEIISVDSAMVYRGMDIGTAKPGPAVRAQTVHHLIDIRDPAESYSTGSFHADAEGLIAAIHGRGRIPLLVGGTMLYFHGLLHGIAALPPADASLRQALQDELARCGLEAMHAELARIDPQAAARIHPNDPQRILRALEVFRITGRPLSTLQRAAGSEPGHFVPVKIILMPEDRGVLHRRIRDRFVAMMDAGFLEEVAALHGRGDLHPGLPSIRSVGYRQAWAHLEGEYDRTEFIDRAIYATRQLARRQMTWLRRERDAMWLTMEDRNLHHKLLEAVRHGLDVATFGRSRAPRLPWGLC